jgi:hypothetical protein
MKSTLRSLTAVAALPAFLLAAYPTFAETIVLRATLSAGAEVISNPSKGSGTAQFSYDTASKQLDYSVTYSGLSSSATVVDIHGPAPSRANAGVIVAFPIPDSPISGTATLTVQQAAALLSGQLYVDVHTRAYADGEIRGQIEKAPAAVH